MRIVGTILMFMGAFVLIAAALSIFGMNLRANGIDIVGGVTSLPAAMIAGGILLIGGAWIRRRAGARAASRSAI